MDDLIKGKKNMNGLVPIKRMVTRGGKTYETTVYIRQGQEDKLSRRGARRGYEIDDFWWKYNDERSFYNALDQIKNIDDPAEKEIYRNAFIDHLKESGLQWDEHEDKAINWMRALMKAKREIKIGQFRPAGGDELFNKIKETPYNRVSKEQARSIIAEIKKAYTKEQIHQMAKDDPNIEWKECEHEGINHMRIMIAIRESLEDGQGFLPVNEMKPIYNEEQAEKRKAEGEKRMRADALKRIIDKLTSRDVHVEAEKMGMRLVYSEQRYDDLGTNKFEIYTLLDRENKIKCEVSDDLKTVKMTRYNQVTGDLEFSKEVPANDVKTLLEVVQQAFTLSTTVTFDVLKREQTENDKQTMETRKSIKTQEFGLQSNDIDSRLAYKKSLETGETLWVAHEYDEPRFVDTRKTMKERNRERPKYSDYGNDRDKEFWDDLEKWNEGMKDIRAINEETVNKMMRQKAMYTEQEIREWGEKWGVDIEEDVYTKVPKKLFNHILPVFEEMLTAFPQLKTNVSKSSNEKKIKLGVYTNRHKGAYACANDSGIWICPASLKLRKCYESIAYGIETGFHDIGDGTYKSIIRHEFGHVLEFNMLKRMYEVDMDANPHHDPNSKNKNDHDPRTLTSKNENFVNWDKASREFWQKCYDGLEGATRYAKYDNSESFAEAFAEWTCKLGDKKSDKSACANEFEKLLVEYGFLDYERIQAQNKKMREEA